MVSGVFRSMWMQKVRIACLRFISSTPYLHQNNFSGILADLHQIYRDHPSDWECQPTSQCHSWLSGSLTKHSVSRLGKLRGNLKECINMLNKLDISRKTTSHEIIRAPWKNMVCFIISTQFLCSLEHLASKQNCVLIT